MEGSNPIGRMIAGQLDPIRHEANGHMENFYEWAERVSHHIEAIAQEVTAERAAEQYRWIYANGATAATGDVTIDLGRPNRGTAWLIKLITTTTGAVPGGGFALYFHEQATQTLIYAGDTDPQMNTEIAEIYVPEATRILGRLFNLGGANVQCTIGVQVKQLQLNPRVHASPAGVSAVQPGQE